MTDKSRNILLGILVIGIIAMTIAYAALSQALNINGSAQVQGKSDSWNIHFAHISSGSEVIPHEYATVASQSISLTETNTVATMPAVTLKAPGDYVVFKFDVINEGDITGYINTINNISLGTPSYGSGEDLTSDEKTAFEAAITATLTYDDQNKTALSQNDSIAKNERKNLILTIRFNNTAGVQKLPKVAVTYSNITASIIYGQDQVSQGGGNGGNTPSVTYNIGDLVYFDPVSDSTCDSSSFDATAIAQHTGTCYKWRVISVGSTNLVLQLDHSIVDNMQWTNSTSTIVGPANIFGALQYYTSSWTRVDPLNYQYDTSSLTNGYGLLSCVDGACTTSAVGASLSSAQSPVRARMITLEELKAIIMQSDMPYKNNFTNFTQASEYNDPASDFRIVTAGSNITWLLENTNSDYYMFESGATDNVYGSNSNGYWTMNPYNTNNVLAWRLDKEGVLSYTTANSSSLKNSVRPVIDIPQSLATKD